MIRDIAFRMTPDGGEVDIVNGDELRELSLAGPFAATLFSRPSWFDLVDGPAEPPQFCKLLDELPPTAYNLRRLEAAALHDLQDFVRQGLVAKLSVSASVTGLDRLTIEVAADGLTFSYSTPWSAL